MNLSDAIREALRECGQSQYALCKATGVDKAALSRFLSGERGMLLENLEALLEAAGLEIHVTKAKKARQP